MDLEAGSTGTSCSLTLPNGVVVIMDVCEHWTAKMLKEKIFQREEASYDVVVKFTDGSQRVIPDEEELVPDDDLTIDKINIVLHGTLQDIVVEEEAINNVTIK